MARTLPWVLLPVLMVAAARILAVAPAVHRPVAATR